MSILSLRQLSSADAQESYVLSQLARPEMDLAAWTERLADQDWGVLGAHSVGTLRGILVFERVKRGNATALFVIRDLVAFDLFEPAEVAGALVNEACSMARAESHELALALNNEKDALVRRLVTECATLHRVF